LIALACVVKPSAAIDEINKKESISTNNFTSSFGNKSKELKMATPIKSTANQGIVILCDVFSDTPLLREH